MQRKTKINVLLPIRLVGELDELSRAGKHSQFIETAIREKYFDERGITIREASSKVLMHALSQREDISEFVRKTIELELKLE